MKAFIRSVCDLLDNGETLTLATVVQSSGSTPRSSGAKMAVRADGSIVGTVGGGLAEAMACTQGQKMIEAGNGTASLLYVDMTQELAANSDMICGGGLSILLETVEPGSPCAEAYWEMDRLMRKGVRAALSSRYEGGEKSRAVDHAVFTGDSGEVPVFEQRDSDMLLMEPFVPPAPLFIFGAGHVSLFTARVGSMVGFRTVVLDDRDDFANRERFPDADDVIVLNSLDGCCHGLGVDSESYIIIVTRGHLHDRNVLAEALRTNAKYIGMIGSKKKRDKIYDSLLADGFTQADIDRCYCPIGLTIGAQTPEEIGVAIGGELIAVRSGHDA